MELEKKIEALDRIYEIYDRFSAGLDVACEKTCAHCCTTNVTLTTLEGYQIVGHLAATGKLDTIGPLADLSALKRYHPQVSTNRLAELVAADAKVPPEAHAATADSCPLLQDALCAIYDRRPFGCRCFVSRRNCAETGFADIDDFTASVNTVFLQIIEHVDREGCSGNLIDVLQVLAPEDRRKAYENNSLKCEANGLIENWPLKVLMIPPEHRADIEPILEQLRQIKI